MKRWLSESNSVRILQGVLPLKPTSTSHWLVRCMALYIYIYMYMGQLLVLLQPWCFFPLFCRNAYIQCITVIVLDNEISKEIKKFKT